MNDPIDYLKPDVSKPPSQNYALISVVSPTSKQKNETCGVKIKGVYDTIEIAKMEAKRMMQIDALFDIYLVEVGKWLPIPPDTSLINNQEYQDEQLNEIIQGHIDNTRLGNQMFEERKNDLMQGKIDPAN